MYDILIIGSGPGGYVAAIKAAQMGAKTALIEEGEFGGTCLNVGCIPTKALVQSAHLYKELKSASKAGFEIDSIKVDWSKIQHRLKCIVETQRKGLAALFTANGIDIIKGHGIITSASTARVESELGVQEIEAKKIIIATGSEPIELPGLEFDGDLVINSDDAIYMEELPSSMIIVGGGVIGCEIACIYATFGVKVTIVELLDTILPVVDPEIVKLLNRSMKKMKIKVLTSHKVLSAIKHEASVVCKLDNCNEIEADKVLVVVGRKARITGNGISALNLHDGGKAVEVDDRCATNMENVWAIGDVTGQWFLAHSASKMGEVAVANAMGQAESMDDVVIPSGIFTSLEIGSVGLNEEEATSRYKEVKVGKYLYRPLGRALAAGTLDGMFKVIAEAKTDKIVGVHIIGHGATDLVAEGVLAIQKELTLTDIANTVHTHPTYTEGFHEACTAALGIGVHSMPVAK